MFEMILGLVITMRNEQWRKKMKNTFCLITFVAHFIKCTFILMTGTNPPSGSSLVITNDTLFVIGAEQGTRSKDSGKKEGEGARGNGKKA
jgi:hypothetical protein